MTIQPFQTGTGLSSSAVALSAAPSPGTSTRRGRTDVTVLERRRLTEGTTWHAAGLVGQLRSSAALTGLMRASVRTYGELEQLTGYATGWRAAGSVRVAASDGRLAELERHVAVAGSVGPGCGAGIGPGGA